MTVNNLKKFIKLAIVSMLLVAMLLPQTALASNTENTPEWEDANFTEEEFNAILANNPNNGVSTCATGLIAFYSMAVSKDGNNLLIAGYTDCAIGVVKCGFKEIVIQRRANSSSSWSDYKEYTSLYADSDFYRIGKTVAVPSGYQYRVSCIHYAKKNILSTQKIDNTSNIVII